MKEELYRKVTDLIKKASRVTAFTGAGISVESGIPPFRGEDGLWNKYDPVFLELDYFYSNPRESWRLNKEIFYSFFGKAQPNQAHRALAKMEKKGFLEVVITQNIDALHQKAGSKNVIEFHGTSRTLSCIECETKYTARPSLLKKLPPVCSKCQGILKPDYIFFGEPIPEPARTMAFQEAENTDLMLVIGTTGEVQPASLIPFLAKENGAKIVEINTRKSRFTDSITDIFLKGKAGQVMGELMELLDTE
jgi:NAD-dependent deacetylase